MKILVIGAGLSGLTTATTLAKQGYEVTVLAEKVGIDSASIVATAIWHVYLVDPDDQKILDWSSRTLEVLLHLAATEAESGVELIEGVELFRDSEEAQARFAGTATVWLSPHPRDDRARRFCREPQEGEA